ncbi:monoamine oxidase [Nocardia transvalensis]|uniref:Monoamine oxidase n=1 Tax=Nocardia transvalensis TaxID=37333 RepID=A0A7W9PJD2_9NOCA|nr:FAD-dependent oxidoreductase [Nocardia transvalensis]MBB5916798.1 monoamine oxidase [Nocardia transvalensis]
MYDADVIVVGAGLAGLVAARELERTGLDVLVVEAADRVGGKTLTAHIGDDHVDLGAHWIGPRQARIIALAAELEVPTRPQPVTGKNVLRVNGRRHVFRGSVPALNPVTLSDLSVGAFRLWRAHRRAGFRAAAAGPVDSQTAAELARQVFHTRDARALVNMFTGLLLGADLEDVSAAYLLAYLRSGGGVRFLSEFKGGAQQDFFVGGAQQLCERIAARLRCPVATGTRVTGVVQDDDGVTVHAGESAWRARRCVMAMAPPLLTRIGFTPALTQALDRLSRQTRLGSYSKYVAVYERPWWREQGYSGIGFATDGPLQMVVDGCADSGRGILVGFSTGASARRMAALDAADRRAAAVDAMAELLGPEAAAATDFFEIEWADVPLIEGGPVAFVPSGAGLPEHFPPPPHQHVHWAGTDYAVRNNGYLDGAIESGERAARAIVGTGAVTT